jgi:hypothetical protein
VRRNLPAARSGVAGIGIFCASRPRSALLIGGLVIHTATLRVLAPRAALIRGRLAASARLGRTTRLHVSIHLLRIAPGLGFPVSRSAATFCVISHGLLLDMPSLHFVRARSQRQRCVGCGLDEPELFCVYYRTESNLRNSTACEESSEISGARAY